jgi:hypothetical protein
VAVTTDLHITGKVAQFGRGIMGDVSAKLMAQFADNLNQMIDDDQSPAPTPGAAADAGPSSGSGSSASGSSASASSPTATSSDSTGAGDDAGDGAPTAAPQIRKIEGPATEPIDLMEIGKGSVLKRVLPALAAVVILAIFLRRRRG